MVAAVLFASVAAGARQAPYRFTSQADLVLIDALVTHDRRVVTGLTAGDFELLDNGIPQTIQQFYLEKLPLTVIMVLDTSGSVEGERLENLKKGAGVVVDRLRAGDRAAIVSFSARLDLRGALTDDRAALHQAIRGLEAEGSTALMDATFAALALRGATATRTLVIVFSDGVDTASILDEERVAQIARRSDATVYAIGIRDRPIIEFRASGTVFRSDLGAVTDDRFLSRIARETGGRLIYADENRQIATTFARVIEEFNNRYVLGYTPTGVAAAGWHEVTVRLRKRPATVLARRGYFAS